MPKSKSQSCSQADKKRIIKIVHSKVTPLRFKYKLFKPLTDSLYQNINLSNNKQTGKLPQLNRKRNKSENISLQQNRLIQQNKYIYLDDVNSLINYLAADLAQKKAKQHSFQSRKQILNTQTLQQEEQILQATINSSPDTPFQSYFATVLFKANNPFNNNRQFMLLERKKMLKNLKTQISTKKTKILDTNQNKQNILNSPISYENINTKIMNTKQNMKSKQNLKKRYHPQRKFQKQLKNISTKQLNSVEQLLITQIQEKQNPNNIKNYINLFQQNNNNKNSEKSPFSKQKTSRFINCTFFQDNQKSQERTQNKFETNRIESQTNNIKNLLEFRQNDKQILASLINAKLRLKSNHKKIINQANNFRVTQSKMKTYH